MRKSFLSKGTQKSEGFTLVELLLVMAIIGILAATISIGMKSSRAKARVTSALKTANNVKVELADCYLRGKTIVAPALDGIGGGQICPGAGIYPALPNQCVYGGYASDILTITCGSGSNTDTITCNTVDTKCTTAKTL